MNGILEIALRLVGVAQGLKAELRRYTSPLTDHVRESLKYKSPAMLKTVQVFKYL